MWLNLFKFWYKLYTYFGRSVNGDPSPMRIQHQQFYYPPILHENKQRTLEHKSLTNNAKEYKKTQCTPENKQFFNYVIWLSVLLKPLLIKSTKFRIFCISNYASLIGSQDSVWCQPKYIIIMYKPLLHLNISNNARFNLHW
jgi:hypothetical protein